jgi:two-component system cell cycle sensor histidine kinase/response regulator CckA
MKDLRISGLLALVLALATLAVIVYFSERNWQRFHQASVDADRARSVLTLSENVLDLLRDAETGQRGFVLTGRESYLKPYYTAVQSVSKNMAQLAALSQLGDQSRRLAALQPLITEKLQELKETIELRRASGVAAAMAVVLSDRGKEVMDQIRQRIRDLQVEESAKLAASSEALEREVQGTQALILIGATLLAFLVSGAFLALRSAAAQRDRLILDLGHARDAAVEAGNLLQTTLSSIGDGVITTDSEGIVTFMNDVASQLTGWEADEARSLPLSSVFRIVNENTGAEVESPVSRVLKDGVIAGLANHTQLISKDGRRIPIDDSGAPIKYKDRMVGTVLVFRDIVERRRAEQQAGYLAALVESSEDAIIGKSLDGIIQSWNASAARLFDYRTEEIVGRPMNELVPPDRLHEEAEILRKLGRGERVDHFETLRLRKDGTLIDVSLTISPVRDKAGQIIGASHIARDITEQKRSAENMRQVQKLETLGVLAGGIAHDFNNLLVGILGNASLALDQLQADSPIRASLGGVIAAGHRAAQLTRQMLAYSGKGRFVIEPIDLSARIRETVVLIQAAIPHTVELRLDLEQDPPGIEADASQIQQLVMNLIINGAEAIPEGRPGTVTITTHRQEVDEQYVRTQAAGSIGELKPGAYVLLEIRDTGSGMDEATKARLFDPFFTTKFTGRGLGLAAVLGIVRGHRGSIRVSSTPGQGSVFCVLFPTLGVAAGREAQDQKKIFKLAGAGTILVIDDEPVVRKMTQQTLERYGYSVLLAEDGERGLEVFRRESDHIKCVRSI